MEGKGLPIDFSRTITATVLVLVAVVAGLGEANAQVWPAYSGSFLEPTQFSIVKSAQDRTLRLQMGYGAEFLGSNTFRLGTEGLVWSRLRALPEFRFPVERADYFFGLFTRFSLNGSDSIRSWRLRLSHISSHMVDGSADTAVGGSSSHYSREFITLERLFRYQLGGMPVTISLGIRYVFHQVTQVEHALQIPIVLEVGMLRFGQSTSGNETSPTETGRSGLFATLTSASDPSGASLGGFLTLRTQLISGALSDLYFGYRYGPRMEGNDAWETTSQLEAGLRLEPNW